MRVYHHAASTANKSKGTDYGSSEEPHMGLLRSKVKMDCSLRKLEFQYQECSLNKNNSVNSCRKGQKCAFLTMLSLNWQLNSIIVQVYPFDTNGYIFLLKITVTVWKKATA